MVPAMDASSAVQISSLDLRNQISVAVAAKAMQSDRSQGEAALALLDSATKIVRAQSELDSQCGQGSKLDTYA